MRTDVAKMPTGIGQRGIRQWWLAEAREASAAALAALARRSGRPALDRASLGHGDDAAAVADAEALAQLGQAVVALAEEVDALRVQLAARQEGARR
jgi:hypothetical protein